MRICYKYLTIANVPGGVPYNQALKENMGKVLLGFYQGHCSTRTASRDLAASELSLRYNVRESGR